jgi:hypothetical protein
MGKGGQNSPDCTVPQTARVTDAQYRREPKELKVESLVAHHAKDRLLSRLSLTKGSDSYRSDHTCLALR